MRSRRALARAAGDVGGAGVAGLGRLLAAVHSAVAIAVGATAVAMLLMLALLILTVLLMVLLGRRGLGGDRRGAHQRQSGEKIFHHRSPEGRIVEMSIRRGIGAGADRIAAGCRRARRPALRPTW